MALASDVLQKLSVSSGGTVVVAGGIEAIGATLTPGGIDVAGPSIVRDNLTVGTTDDQLSINGKVLASGNDSRVPQGWTGDVVSGGAVQNFAISLPMSGPDQDYEIEATLITSTSAQALTAQPNGVATDQFSSWVGRDGSSVYHDSATDLYIFDQLAGSSETINVLIRVSQKAGQPRQLTAWVTYGDGGHTVWMSWNVTTEITSFRFRSSVSGGILDDSMARARRV